MMLLVVLLAACQCPVPQCPQPATPAPEAKPDEPPPGVDASMYGALDNAGQACAILKWLTCPEGMVSTCASDMRTMINLGTFEAANVLCIRQSRTVTRVRTCEVECAR